MPMVDLLRDYLVEVERVVCNRLKQPEMLLATTISVSYDKLPRGDFLPERIVLKYPESVI